MAEFDEALERGGSPYVFVWQNGNTNWDGVRLFLKDSLTSLLKELAAEIEDRMKMLNNDTQIERCHIENPAARGKFIGMDEARRIINAAPNPSTCPNRKISMNEEKMSPPKKYCRYCGAVLAAHRIKRFDEITGIQQTALHCTNMTCEEGCGFIGHVMSFWRQQCKRCGFVAWHGDL